MFICPDCCKEVCKNVDHCWIARVGPTSWGPCENCKKTAVCCDCYVGPVRWRVRTPATNGPPQKLRSDDPPWRVTIEEDDGYSEKVNEKYFVTRSWHQGKDCNPKKDADKIAETLNKKGAVTDAPRTP